MRFSVAQLMLLVAIAGVSTSLYVVIYDAIVIPRTPIVWRTCTPEELRQQPRSTNRIVVTASNATLTGSFYDIRAQLEGPRFRKIVARHSVECWHCNPADHYDSLAVLEGELQLTGISPPYVIVMTRNSSIAYSIKGVMEFAATTDLLELEFQTRGAKEPTKNRHP